MDVPTCTLHLCYKNYFEVTGMRYILLAVVFLTIAGGKSFTQQSEQFDTEAIPFLADIDSDSLFLRYTFPQVNVIGSSPEIFSRIPGSASVLTELEIGKMQPLTGNELLRKVAGLNIVDEEGAGLRVNIGIRGLDPDRSRTVLVLEDGVPVALTPYGEPEMYYTPSIDRMKSIEVLKGSGSILFGPQTIGGVINYITDDPPQSPRFRLKLTGGDQGFASGRASYGTTTDNMGFLVSIFHKRADKLGTTSFRVNDITTKFRLALSGNSRLGIKLSAYDEHSNSTYLGITQTMYDKGEYYTVMAPFDNLDIRRYSGSITHDVFFSSDFHLKTTLFGYTTTRNWLRQDFRRTPASSGTVAVFGDTTVSNGAVYMRNSTGNRNRQFEVAGIEPRLSYFFKVGDLRNEFEGGVRFLYEKAFEQRVDGKKANAESGDLREDETRTGYAVSIFAQNRFYLTQELSVTPGARLESFWYERDIFRLNFKDTSLVSRDDVLSVVPGIGISYAVTNGISLFGGVHRGFAPPRIKDAITNGGKSLQLSAELSWNYEVGVRGSIGNVLSFEATGYALDFSNQIIPVSESSGGAGTGLVNGGSTLHTGVEIGLTFYLNRVLGSRFDIVLHGSGNYSNAKFDSDRYLQQGTVRVNINGNRLPYAPEYQLSGGIDILMPFGLTLQIAGNYTAKQFTDQLNTVQASVDGETGEMPAFYTMDVTGRYELPSVNSQLYVSIKNLTDERYIASRRPQGIKVGIPRFITAGVEINL